MKTSSIILALVLLAVSPLRAQLVADGATNTLSNVTSNITGTVTVGTNLAFTLLVLSDNALLTNSIDGVVGRNAPAKSNEVRLASPSARWLMGSTLYIGSNGAFNRLTISNGAVVADVDGFLGHNPGASNNVAVVTGVGSLWTNSDGLLVGYQGGQNQLVVGNGGVVANGSGYLGYFSSANNDVAVVTGAGSVWSNRLDLNVGFDGAGNLLIASNGAVVTDVDGFLGHNPGASNNVAVVTGVGSLWTHNDGLLVGYQEGRNQLVVSNGAVVADEIGYLGYFSSANNNLAVVTGAGSAWSNRLDLNVGFDGKGNQLVAGDGGTVLASNLFVGFSGISANNRVTLNGGTLLANVLDVRRGTNVLNAGLIDVDRLVLTNTQGVFEFNGGTLVSRGAQISAGMTVGASGTSPAVWNVRPGAFDHVLSLGVVVGNASSFNRLIVSGGALLTNGGFGYVGRGAGANSNSASVSGIGSRWRMAGEAGAGVGGAFNQLTVSNGGLVSATSGRVGGTQFASSNNVATVTGAGSMWNNAGSLLVGDASPGNQLLLGEGGAVFAGNGVIGQNATARDNTVLVSDAGSEWQLSGNLEVGSGGSFNRLIVGAGAFVSDLNGAVGNSVSSSNNTATVTGAGSLWDNLNTLSVGAFGGGSQLVVSNGGRVITSSGGLGDSSANNQAVVTGSGSVWNNTDYLNVGSFGAANQLMVKNGGLLVSGFGYIGESSDSNTVSIMGAGSLWSNRLDQSIGVRGTRNELVVSAGGTAFTGGNGLIGEIDVANSNMVIVGDSGSRWLVTSNLAIGNQSSFNRLVISNGGFVGSRVGFVGSQSSASNNVALVTGPGSVWSNLNTSVGFSGSGNQLVVSNGGLMFATLALSIGSNSDTESNQVVVTGPGSVLDVPSGHLHIGLAGFGNRLMVSNGGLVMAALGSLGSSDGSIGNEALVTGAGSLWSNRFDLNIGSDGAANRLLINNGGTVFGSNVFVGFAPSATNNRVIVNGGTLRATSATGTGVLDVRRGTNVLNAGLIDVDNLALTNKGTIINPAVFGNSGSINIPTFSPASPYPSIVTVVGLFGTVNKVSVTLSNLSHTVPENLDILLVSPAGQKVMLMSDAGGTTAIATVRLTFDDAAAVAVPTTTITTGAYRPTDYFPGDNLPAPAPSPPHSTSLSSFNGSNPNGVWSLYISGDTSPGGVGTLIGWSLQISTDEGPFLDLGAFELNGGTLVTRGAVIDNTVPFVVGGPGGVPALWEVRAGANDHFVARDLIVGSLLAGSSNNLLHVNGATLNAGTLDIRAGTNRLDAGLVDVDRLVVTNTRGQFDFNGGTLRTPNTTVANGRVFTVGNGASVATLQLLGGTHIFANNLVVATNGSLIGNGVIDGTVTVSAGGRLVPGAPIGRVSVLGTAILQGTVNLQIDKSGGVRTNDQVAASGAIFYSGTLNVTDIGTDVLAAGDRFFLFSAAPYVGQFTTISLPPLSPGLAWANNLSVDGSFEVVAAGQPGFANISLSGTNMIFAGTNGTPNAAYTVLAATNVALPLSNWVSIATNQFDPSGRFTFTNRILPGIPQRFFRLRMP